MKPISLEKRDIIVTARARGESVDTIISWLGVSRATIYNICKLYRTTNSIAPKPFPGKKSGLAEKQLDEIRQTVVDNSDITLAELIEKLNLPIQKSQLSRILTGMKFSLKKNSFPKRPATRRRNRKTGKVAKKAKKAKRQAAGIS